MVMDREQTVYGVSNYSNPTRSRPISGVQSVAMFRGNLAINLRLGFLSDFWSVECSQNGPKWKIFQIPDVQ